VEDLRVSTQELLDENNWIDKETKRLVAEKMEAMSVLAGFPEWISNVSSLDHYYEKVRAADVASGSSVCCFSIIIVSLLYVQRAAVSRGVSHANQNVPFLFTHSRLRCQLIAPILYYTA
jgi:Predicted metalloendopeptidase